MDFSRRVAKADLSEGQIVYALDQPGAGHYTLDVSPSDIPELPLLKRDKTC